MDNFNFFLDDWKKIPQNYRFILLAGAILIFNSWLLDHWGLEKPYLFWIWDVRAFGYSLGLTLIIIALTLLVSRQFLLFGKLVYYRLEYPLSKLNKDFFLTSFRGYVVLFHLTEKKYYHIVPYETAQDLLFVDKWNYLENKPFPPEPKDLLQVGHINLWKEFRYFDDGGEINTRA